MLDDDVVVKLQYTPVYTYMYMHTHKFYQFISLVLLHAMGLMNSWLRYMYSTCALLCLSCALLCSSCTVCGDTVGYGMHWNNMHPYAFHALLCVTN